MGQVTLGEQAAPATPASGVTIYPTVATPSILRVIDDGGNDRALVGATNGVFTPGLTFGGAAAGMTFTQQWGRWQRLSNNLIRVQGYISLSAKGSSTGDARVSNLPVISEATAFNFHPAIVRLQTMSSISGNIQAFVASGSTTIDLEHLGTGTAVPLTHANFNNTSSVFFQVWYEI